MAQDAAFLRQFAANPSDDATRLVYADWLDERDDPRGRYLRLEIELAGLAEDSKRYAELEAELQALRLDIDPGWLEQAGKRFDLLLHGYLPDQKIQTIKALRELTGRGLKEAKDLSEAPPPVLILAGVLRADAERGREHLRYAYGRKVADATLRVSTGPARQLSPAERAAARCELVLLSYHPNEKLAVVRVLREVTGLALMEARLLAEAAPVTILENRTLPEVEQLAAQFAGIAEVEVRQRGVGTVPLAAAGPPVDFVLRSYEPAHKITVIKAIREATGCGLKEAKDLSEGPLPLVLRTGLTPAEGRRLGNLFQGMAVVEVRPAAQ
jgi:uncharacterized protein (TIGR02996 family)